MITSLISQSKGAVLARRSLFNKKKLRLSGRRPFAAKSVVEEVSK